MRRRSCWRGRFIPHRAYLFRVRHRRFITTATGTTLAAMAGTNIGIATTTIAAMTIAASGNNSLSQPTKPQRSRDNVPGCCAFQCRVRGLATARAGPLGMERTACLEVEVRDDQGNPLKDAKVSAWPNVRYGGWSSTILTSDCYNSADQFRETPSRKKPTAWGQTVPDFQGISDSTGLAVIPNLPAEANAINVEHPDFVLPASGTTVGGRHRMTTVALTAGQTNRVAVRLERRGESPIAHY